MEILNHKAGPESIQPAGDTINYGSDAKGLRLNAADWIDEKIREDRVIIRINPRGGSRQSVITPACIVR